MSRRRTAPLRILAPGLASLLLLTGCWTSTSSSSADQTTPAASAAPTPTDSAAAVAAPAAACPAGKPDATSYACEGVTVSGAKDAEPTVTLDKEFGPADALKVADVYEGSGTAVASGDTLTVQYVGVGEQSREVFDSSWPSGQPVTFPLTGVIQGWQEGMVGMKPGGRRLLIIPGDLGYGQTGSGSIGPDETLVFVVDLVSVTPADAATP